MAEDAVAARGILQEAKDEIKKRVEISIAAHRKIFEQKTEPERIAAADNSQRQGAELAHKRHHRVACPACKSVATVQGEPVGRERVTVEDDGIRVEQSIAPRTFQCSACGLNLKSYVELDAAGVGAAYTRTTQYSPEEYYGLVNPDDIDPSDYVDDVLKILNAQEYDNE
jgi:hypothetical protein